MLNKILSNNTTRRIYTLLYLLFQIETCVYCLRARLFAFAAIGGAIVLASSMFACDYLALLVIVIFALISLYNTVKKWN